MKFKTATTPEFFVICLLILFLDLPFRLRPSPATMSVTQLAAFQELISSMRDLQVSSYTCGAGMVVLLYDFILTIPEEVKYVWSGKQRLSMVRAMYFWNRYFTVPWIIVANYHIAGLRGPLSNQLYVSRPCKNVLADQIQLQGLYSLPRHRAGCIHRYRYTTGTLTTNIPNCTNPPYAACSTRPGAVQE
ncbi:hypothetical protein PIIN_01753 [Serendipita indica DSM 11827]|uniref:DUF6533 domain-containing protein n=1 Tax=Serendipita indica (strain DSM 11827) TaxID=1109443 RepID=G4U3A7_SERID|nr:hypothetical protein PIIN_01753 [Serendipita indica DSM 11827]